GPASALRLAAAAWQPAALRLPARPEPPVAGAAARPARRAARAGARTLRRAPERGPAGMIVIGQGIVLAEKEVEIQPIRAQGAGGQNVNKVSSAIHLRFDVHASSLPDAVKLRLLQRRDQRLTSEG